MPVIHEACGGIAYALFWQKMRKDKTRGMVKTNRVYCPDCDIILKVTIQGTDE